MTTLLGLEPRLAGAATIEPDIEFYSLQDGLHMRTRCVPTCVCSGGSSACGRSTYV